MKPLIYPNTQQVLSFSVDGIFATPDDWKTTDEANPSLFTYTVRCFAFELEKGKIFPRDLTPRQLREQEQKNKKGGKKETKKEEGTGEQQRLRQEEEEERRREEEWSKLPDEDQKYRDYEDRFRSPQLKFENNSKSHTVTAKQLVVLEERILKDRGEWIYIIKSPNASEEQLAKMRKAKPKTLSNINDLNPVVMRAWLDYSALDSKQIAPITQRCKLIQVDKTAETPEPNLEKTYIKIKISLNEPFIRKEDGVTGEQLIADPPAEEPVSQKVRAVEQLRGQIRLGIQSLAMQFSAMFWKELNIYEDFKNINYFVNKKNDITKRKEHFLYDFNVSGKYKILKDRLKKVIVHLCQKYFAQQMGSAKSFTGVSYSLKDQFYSQIYTFLVTKYKEILQELVFEKKENLSEIEVLSPPSQKKKMEELLAGQFKESALEQVQRVVDEYEVLGDYAYGQRLYQNLIQEQPSKTQIKYSYAIYCVKNKLKKPDEILSFIEEYLSYHKDDQNVRLEYLLLLIASEVQENCKKAWVFLRQLISADPSNTTNLLLAAFLFGDLLKMDQLAEKYLFKAERTYLKITGKIPEDGRHQQSPLPSELPTHKGLPSYSESLVEEQKDKIWVQLLMVFMNLNLANIVVKVQSKIKSTNNIVFDLIRLQALLDSKDIESFEAQSKKLYESTKSQQVLDLIVTHLLRCSNSEAQKYLKTNLIKTSNQKQLQALLKLAYFYLNSKQYANARSCVLKYLEKKPLNSGFSWRILGICELYLGNQDEALDSLKKANLSDTTNFENWLWLAKVFSIKGQFVMCNQCLNRYQSIVGKRCKGNLPDEILETLKKSNSNVLSEQKMRIQLIQRLSAQQAS